MDKESVNVRILVETCHSIEKSFLSGTIWKFLSVRNDPHLPTSLMFLMHVIRTGAVTADQNRAQTKNNPLFRQDFGSGCDLLEDSLSYGFALQKFC